VNEVEELWNAGETYFESLSLQGDDEWDAVHDSMDTNRSRREKGPPSSDLLARRARHPSFLPREDNMPVGRHSPELGLKSIANVDLDDGETNVSCNSLIEYTSLQEYTTNPF
jgi:hypothetical protein